MEERDGFHDTVRCVSCQEMGCECPKGYRSTYTRCDAEDCDEAWYVKKAACQEIQDWRFCPVCGGTVTVEENWEVPRV